MCFVFFVLRCHTHKTILEYYVKLYCKVSFVNVMFFLPLVLLLEHALAVVFFRSICN